MRTVVHLTSLHRSNDVRIFVKECRTLAKAGYQVTLIAPHDHGQVEVLDGVTVKPFPRRNNRAMQMLLNPLQMLRVALAERADLYHFHDPQLLPVGFALKLLGKRVIYDAHEDVPSQILTKAWIPGLMRKGISSILRKLEKGACILDGMVLARPALEARFPATKSVIVENFARLEELQLGTQLPYHARGPVVVYFGAISVERGAFDMIEAMELLPSHSTAELRLAGKYYPFALAEQLQDASRGTNVSLLGWQNRIQIAELLGQARIGLVILHPIPNYLGDGHPTKLIEYMAAGIPSIVTDLPLMREFVEEIGCGLVVPPHDPQAVADAIQWLLEHPKEAEEMGERGRQAVLERYNWDVEARKLLGLYRRILGETVPAVSS